MTNLFRLIKTMMPDSKKKKKSMILHFQSIYSCHDWSSLDLVENNNNIFCILSIILFSLLYTICIFVIFQILPYQKNKNVPKVSIFNWKQIFMILREEKWRRRRKVWWNIQSRSSWKEKEISWVEYSWQGTSRYPWRNERRRGNLNFFFQVHWSLFFPIC